MNDIRQSLLWARFMTELGWEADSLTKEANASFAYSKKLPLLGSLLKIPKINSPIPFSEIETLAKKKRALFLKLEPNSYMGDKTTLKALVKNGFQADSWSLQPTKTIVVDISSSAETILSRMEKDTRYCIRAAEKRGVKTALSSDLEIFWDLYQKTAKRGKFWIMRQELEKIWQTFFKENRAVIVLATSENEPLAAALLLFHEKTAYYYHAASSSEHRDLFATYLVVWESILESKRRGCLNFDLLGIEDKRIRSTRNWAGFSHFKKGFGGEEKTYLGSFIKFYNPLIRLIFSLNRFF